MFIINKYHKYYFSIINNRKENPVEGYTEKHHIIPKSMGGSNDKSNLVNLTAREHFICHRLLVKFTEGKDKQKMWYAIWAFIGTTKRKDLHKFNSRIIEQTRIKISESFKAMHANPDSIFKSKEYKEKISKASKINWQNEDYKIKMHEIKKELYARPDIKEKISKINKENQNTPEAKEKRKNIAKTMWENEEYRIKNNKAHKEALLNPEYKQQRSNISKSLWGNEDFKNKHKESMKQVYLRPEYKEKRSNIIKEKWADPIYRANMMESRRKAREAKLLSNT